MPIHRIAVARAAVALLWAAALVAAIGHRVPTTDSDIPFAAAALLTLYPLIDVVASLATGRSTALRLNAAISGLATLAIGVAAFGSDAGAALAAFGVWAVVSGAIQFALDRRLPLLISGGLSTIAGVSFLSAAGMDDANLAVLGGYMAVGAILYLASAATIGRGVRSSRP